MLTANRQPPAHAFKPGNKAAVGRKPGSRNLLADKFFKDIYALWEEQGDAALRRAAFENPVAFVGIVAKLMPAKLEISTPTDGMTDEQLLRMIELAERMAAIGATNARASMTFGGGGDEAMRGGGSPHDALMRGEVIEGVLLAGPPTDLDGTDPLLAAAPLGDPPSSIIAETLVAGIPTADVDEVDAEAGAEVDPLSLF